LEKSKKEKYFGEIKKRKIFWRNKKEKYFGEIKKKNILEK